MCNMIVSVVSNMPSQRSKNCCLIKLEQYYITTTEKGYTCTMNSQLEDFSIWCSRREINVFVYVFSNKTATNSDNFTATSQSVNQCGGEQIKMYYFEEYPGQGQSDPHHAVRGLNLDLYFPVLTMLQGQCIKFCLHVHGIVLSRPKNCDC